MDGQSTRRPPDWYGPLACTGGSRRAAAASQRRLFVRLDRAAQHPAGHPDPDGEEGQHLFEVIGGAEEPFPVYHFLLAHGFEDEGAGNRQQALKQ